MADIPNSSFDSSRYLETRHGGLSPTDPFAAPLEDRRGDRRFRGRLVAPVTVWTAGVDDRHAGLTVSSLLIAEGDPAVVIGLLDPLSDLFNLVIERGAFVVHVLKDDDRRIAGMFAGAYPVDPFEEVETEDGDFGPVILGARHSLGCRLGASEEVGFQMLVRGQIHALKIEEGADQPLVRYRGRYRKLSLES